MISQPPQKDDPVDGAWTFEVASQHNALEQRLKSLLDAIREATDLNDLKDRIEDL